VTPGILTDVERVLLNHKATTEFQVQSVGGDSAASTAFAAHIGKQFKRVGSTLTIG
jgi:hypothetical protein